MLKKRKSTYFTVKESAQLLMQRKPFAQTANQDDLNVFA